MLEQNLAESELQGGQSRGRGEAHTWLGAVHLPWEVKRVDFFPPVLKVTQILLGLMSCPWSIYLLRTLD